MSPGHLYHYFDSKQAIIAQLSALKLQEAAERFERAANGHASIPAAILAEIDGAMRSGGPADYALLFEMLAEATRSPTWPRRSALTAAVCGCFWRRCFVGDRPRAKSRQDWISSLQRHSSLV